MKIPDYKIELAKMAGGNGRVVGVDEVGRGCLAGPVVAAAVALDPASISKGRKPWHAEVRDSKLLTPEKRFILEPVIKEHSLGWGIGVVTPRKIDALNIHHAGLLAMRQAVDDLRKTLKRFDKRGTSTPMHLLIDGRFTLPDCDLGQTAIIDGDASVLSISAASIIAKTYRDRLMVKLHQKFPVYNFARHKGYATLEHRAAIHAHGLTAVHRLSFCGKFA